MGEIVTVTAERLRVSPVTLLRRLIIYFILLVHT